FSFSQTQYFYGKILDSSDSVGIPDVHIFFRGRLLGTTTNNLGEFTLKVAGYNKIDSAIEISVIGYESISISLKAWATKSSDSIRIFLNPSSIILNDLIVNYAQDSVKKILKKALIRISKNYYNTNTIQEAFFREMLLQDDKCLRLIEAFTEVHDPGIKRSPFKIKAEIKQLRRSDDLSNTSLINKTANFLFAKKYNPLIYLLNWDIVRHYKVPSPNQYAEDFQIFNLDKSNNEFDYFLEEILTSSAGKIFKVKFVKNLSSSTIQGFVYVKESDYAILKIEFEECFYEKVEKGLWQGCMLKGVLEYKATNNKYHLFYASLRKGIMPDFGSAIQGQGGDRLRYFQLLVQNIYTSKYKIPRESLEIQDRDFSDKKFPYNSAFWISHQVPLLDREYLLAIDRISSDTPIELQFVRNGAR
ncbi:MAG: carboxypeptidase-like regulatory domain-containing protein, partial [Flammeovirgaceae bacterium]